MTLQTSKKKHFKSQQSPNPLQPPLWHRSCYLNNPLTNNECSALHHSVTLKVYNDLVSYQRTIDVAQRPAYT